jgi:hypothetical protein
LISVRYCYAFAIAVWLVSFVLPAAEINGSMQLSGHRAVMIGIESYQSCAIATSHER